MQANSIGEQVPQRDQASLSRVSLLGVLLVLSFAVICFLSPPFEYGSSLKRPTLIVTGLLLLSAVIAFFALINALKISSLSMSMSSRRSHRQLLLVIVGIALSTRLVALFTCPILEIDYYRYMWDGRVAAAGVSPYRYAPEQILQAPLNATGSLRELNSLATRTESNHTVLSRIHFESHTTIYPPVSQFVFSVAMSMLPESASVKAHIIFMKFVLLLFDVGTLLLVLGMCKILNRHVGWLIVYAWNPLVIKEIANGGHLDSIATMLTVLSVFLFIQWCRSANQRRSLAAASAIALGLGVGAKLFSVVVFPILFVVMFQKNKLTAFMFSLIFAGAVGMAMWPMLSSLSDRQSVQLSDVEDISEPEQGFAERNFNRDEPNQNEVKNREGLTAFLSSWRMNDVVFSGVYLNLKDMQRGSRQPPWYVFTSKEFRSGVCGFCNGHGFGGDDPAYAVTRIFTLGLFSIFYLYQLFLIVKVDGESDHRLIQLVQRIGWILVAFLFLQPTVNPWYLLWAIPFCSFSNNRGWLLVSGVLLVYYSRFWFKSLTESFEIGGTVYSGAGLFDHVVAWGEHLAIGCDYSEFSDCARAGEDWF